MKKQILTFASIFVMGTLLLLACKKKQDDTIHPTYKEEASGTASNPTPNNVTVTGVTNTNTPATENSYLTVGGAGWTSAACNTYNFLLLKSSYGSCDATLQFATPPTMGTFTYNISSTPGLQSCALTVTGNPDQPAGTVWYGYEGSVVVNTSTLAGPPTATVISAQIIGSVKCHQSTFNFPIVSVGGVLGCSSN